MVINFLNVEQSKKNNKHLLFDIGGKEQEKLEKIIIKKIY